MQATLQDIDDSVSFLTEREQATRDEQADVQYERVQRVERALTFDDVLEEMAGFTEDMKSRFMTAQALANQVGAEALHVLIGVAKSRVIARRLAAGE